MTRSSSLLFALALLPLAGWRAFAQDPAQSLGSASGASSVSSVSGTHIIERAMGGRGRIADIIDASFLLPRQAGEQAGRCEEGGEPGPSETFNIFDLTNLDDLGGEDVPCTRVAVTDHAYVYVETALWGGSLINQGVIDSFLNLFESATPEVSDPPYVYPSIDPSAGILDILDSHLRRLPDSTDDKDADGRDPIFIVFADIPDGYRRPGDLAVNGYFSSVNELCANEFDDYANRYADWGRARDRGLDTNVKEMLVLDIDPSLGSGFRDLVRGVPAHELQHLLHWFADERESTWLDEGIADLTAELVGFPAVGHYQSFLDDHDKTSLARWEQLQEDYGHAGLFMRYLADHPAGGAAERWANMDAVRAIMASADSAVAGVEDGLSRVGDSRSMTDLYLDFSLAMVLQDRDFEDGRYGMPAGGVELEPKNGKFNDALLTDIGVGPVLTDQVTSLTARYISLEPFSADSIFVGLSGPTGLAGRAVLGFAGASDDPVDLSPVEVLDLLTVSTEGSNDVMEALLTDVGIRGDRVLVVATWLDPAAPGGGVANYSAYAAGDASDPGSCLSLLRVGPNPVDPARAGFTWPVRFFGGGAVPACAEILVFDAAGRRVATIDQSPFAWQGEGVAAGLYHWIARGDGQVKRGTIAVLR